MTWIDSFEFSDDFVLLHANEDEAHLLASELSKELGPGHPLTGLAFRIVARALPQDDVILDLDDGRAAIVHLTWAGKAERLPFPTTRFFASPDQLRADLEFRY